MAEQEVVRVNNQDFVKCYEDLKFSKTSKSTHNKLTWEQTVEILSVFEIYIKAKPTDDKVRFFIH